MSKVFEYFEIISETKVKCKFCKKEINRHKATTSNFWYHLRIQHPNLKNVNITMSVKEIQIGEKMALFVCQGLHSFQIVEEKGFRALINQIDPNFNGHISRKALQTIFIPNLFDQLKQKIENLIEKFAKKIALTCDIWTSTTQTSFLGITLHFLTSNFEMIKIFLDLKKLNEDHSGIKLQQVISKILLKWKIKEENIIGFVSDNASNLKIALNTYPHYFCFAHTLQLVIEKAIKNENIIIIINHAKKIVEHFKKSYKSSEMLKFKQFQEFKTLKVLQSVPTRWNSIFIMLERLLLLQQPICAVLRERKKIDLLISEFHWNILKDLTKILKPFNEITIIMSTSSLISIS